MSGATKSMRGRGTLLVIVTAAGLAAVFLGLLVTSPPDARTVDLSGWSATQTATTARGVFHVHSIRSDGSGTVDEIADAARRAGLQFVILTDHGDGTREPAPPVYLSGVLCIDAVEISTNAGHYIALGLPRTPYPLAGEPHAVVEDVRRFGGFGVVAHPTSDKAELAWKDWDLPFDGLEWLNGDSEWRDESTGTLGGAFARYLLGPSQTLASLLDRPDPTLTRWDEGAARRRVVGLAGSDAHARLATGREGEGYRDGATLAFPGYEQLFRVFSLVAELDGGLSGDPETDAELVVTAIRSGRVFTAVDAIASPVRFVFDAESGTGRHQMGARIDTDRPVQLRARVAGPAESEIVLFADGEPVETVTGRELSFTAATVGAYRAEVHLSGAPGTPPVPWIVGNPIYVGPAAAAALPPPLASSLLPDPLDLDAWDVEPGADSRASLGHGLDRVVLDYELSDQPTASAALVHHVEAGRLAEFDSVAFEVRAERPTRAFVQLRVTDAPGDVRWRRSFYAGPEAASVTLRLAELMPVTPDLPAQPDLARVTSLLVAVEAISTLPGQAGSLAIISPRLQRE